MKNNSKLCSILATICIVCAMVCVAALAVAFFESRVKFESIFTYGISFSFGGFLSSIFISRYYFYKGVKKEIAEAVEKTKKDVEESLNKQFNQYREFLNKFHNKSKEAILRRYKTLLVDQLENDMAEIWDVRPGAAVGSDVSLLDYTAMDNADDKYYNMYSKLCERSEELLKAVLKGI